MNTWRLKLWPPTATRAEAVSRAAATLMLLVPMAIFALVVTYINQSVEAKRIAGPRAGPPISSTLFFGIVLLAMLASTAGLALWALLWRKSRQVIQKRAFRLCPRCRYDLSASAPDGTCPECGRAYTDADLHRIWRAAYRIRAEGPMTPNAR